MKGQERKKTRFFPKSFKSQLEERASTEQLRACEVELSLVTVTCSLYSVCAHCTESAAFYVCRFCHRGPSFLALSIRFLFSAADKTSPSFKYCFGSRLPWQWWRLRRVWISLLWIWISPCDIWKLLMLMVFKWASLEIWNHKMINQFVVLNLEDSRLPSRLWDSWIHPQHSIIFLFCYSINGRFTFRSTTLVL